MEAFSPNTSERPPRPRSAVLAAAIIPGNARHCPAKPGGGRHPERGHVAMLPRQGPATGRSDLAKRPGRSGQGPARHGSRRLRSETRGGWQRWQDPEESGSARQSERAVVGIVRDSWHERTPYVRLSLRGDQRNGFRMNQAHELFISPPQESPRRRAGKSRRQASFAPAAAASIIPSDAPRRGGRVADWAGLEN
jgi:hypothetical protein